MTFLPFFWSLPVRGRVRGPLPAELLPPPPQQHRGGQRLLRGRPRLLQGHQDRRAKERQAQQRQVIKLFACNQTVCTIGHTVHLFNSWGCLYTQKQSYVVSMLGPRDQQPSQDFVYKILNIEY